MQLNGNSFLRKASVAGGVIATGAFVLGKKNGEARAADSAASHPRAALPRGEARSNTHGLRAPGEPTKTSGHSAALPIETSNKHRTWLKIAVDEQVLELARLGKLEALNELVQRGGVPMNHAVSANGSSEWAVTPMLMAAMHGHDEVVSFFQSLPVELPRDTQAVFTLAADHGDTAVVQNMLRFSWVDVNGLGKDSRSALHAAAEGGHVGCLDALLRGGADFEWGREQKYFNLGWPSGIVYPEIHCTPLRAACNASQTAAVNYLLDWAKSHDLKHTRSEQQGIYADAVESKNVGSFRNLVAGNVQYTQADVMLIATKPELLRALLVTLDTEDQAKIAQDSVQRLVTETHRGFERHQARAAVLNLLPYCAPEGVTHRVEADAFSIAVREAWDDVVVAMLNHGADASPSAWEALRQSGTRPFYGSLSSNVKHFVCASLVAAECYPDSRDIPKMREAFDDNSAFIALWNDIARLAELKEQRTPRGLRALITRPTPPTEEETALVAKMAQKKASLAQLAQRDVTRVSFL